MVEQTLLGMDEIRAQLDELAEQARAISERVITMSEPLATARSRQRGKSKRPPALRLVANR
jgi:DNA-binding ferritin-like protein